MVWLIVDAGKPQQASVRLFFSASSHLWFKRQTLPLLFRDGRLIGNYLLTPCARRRYLQKCLIWTHLFRFICTSGQSLLKELLDNSLAILQSAACPLWRGLHMHYPQATDLFGACLLLQLHQLFPRIFFFLLFIERRKKSSPRSFFYK